ncbi:fos-related antigen 1-like isoform X2 [Acanthaster planci]|uniref:Fos-related antigen 1-like isoform X2 n=1 Tax=Acanthaster planci TaxID=133434 RepID=A0A8B7ZP44_ACAPL|nr:fos-related antigen 1-like isoform X2 [Acanthaster planci]
MYPTTAKLVKVEADYTASEDIMDISSYAPPMTTSHPMSTHQSAIPTSVITPTSLTSGWLPHLNNNIHGGNFVPPSVSSSSHGSITARHQGSRAVHHGRVRSSDLELLRMSPSTSRRRIRDEDLPPEERDKRRIRRERNKLAAAKCRQRRVDHTNSLIGETEDWEEKNATLEQEISKLHQQKEQLEFILEAHKAMCRQNKANKQTATTSTATSTSSLETPTTEVVTPTSVFNYTVGTTVHNGDASDNILSCGREAIKSESSNSDMSSPEANRTLIQL